MVKTAAAMRGKRAAGATVSGLSAMSPKPEGACEPATPRPLPADDPGLFETDLAGLRKRWSDAARRSPIGAEAMTGADRRAQALGIPGQRLMENAGAAVAAAAQALADATGRSGKGAILILCG